jgi:hypothetical protein
MKRMSRREEEEVEGGGGGCVIAQMVRWQHIIAGPKFKPTAVHTEFLMDKVPSLQGFLQELWSQLSSMHFASWITKARHMLRICNTYCFFMAKMVTWMYHNVMLSVHCLSCYSLKDLPDDHWISQHICHYS